MNTMKNLKNTLKKCVKWTTSTTKRITAMTTTSNTETSKRTCDGIFWEAEADILTEEIRGRYKRGNN